MTLDELDVVTDPVRFAEAAGLVYVDDGGPGIVRRRAGRGFTYVGASGRTVGAAVLEARPAKAAPLAAAA